MREAHEIGRGRSVERQNWYVHDVDGDLELVITHSDRATIRARKTSPGFWEGDFLKMDGGHVVITEPTPAQNQSFGKGVGLLEDLIEASGLGRIAGSLDDSPARELSAALTLHARIEPEFRDALASYEAGSEPIKEVIADVLKATHVDVDRNPVKDADVLEEGYTRPSLTKL